MGQGEAQTCVGEVHEGDREQYLLKRVEEATCEGEPRGGSTTSTQ